MFSVVIIGQKWLAASVFEALEGLPHVSVTTVVCPPSDRLALKAREYGVVNTTLTDCPHADLALAAHCHEFICADIRSRFRLGVLAYHPSLLPRHRGRDAVRWAVHMREPVTGGTLYWMNDGADTGPIEAQEWCHIQAGDTPAGLWRQSLAPMGIKLFVDAVNRLAGGGQPRRKPQDEQLATFEPAFTSKKLAKKI